jgi:hypothetical protein
VSVDTYLKGKNTSVYTRVFDDDVEILVSPTLIQYANLIELVTQKKLVGSKLAVVAHHVHGPSCRH